MTTRFEARIDVDAPPAVVWSVVVDWELQRRWILGTTVHVIGGDGRSVGSRLAAFTGVHDIGFLDTMEITAWDDERRVCHVRHLGKLLRGDGEFAVEARGEHATFVWSEDLEPPFGPLGRVALPLARPVVEASLRLGGRKLRALCADRAAVSP